MERQTSNWEPGRRMLMARRVTPHHRNRTSGLCAGKILLHINYEPYRLPTGWFVPRLLWSVCCDLRLSKRDTDRDCHCRPPST